VSRFLDMFRQSPFRPLHEHMGKVMGCVDFLRPMFEAVRDGQYERLVTLAGDVSRTEHEADVVKEDIRQTLRRSYFLPVFRGDLLAYLKTQDNMADGVEDLAVLLTMKRLALPAALSPFMMEYVDLTVGICRQASEMTDQFRAAVDKRFHPHRVEQLLTRVAAVEQAEGKSDRRQYELCQKLFTLEREMSPTDIILWFKIIGELSGLANDAEALADRVRRMIAFH
jgi:predicted phosphate transport protein (TIGR00153 family)